MKRFAFLTLAALMLMSLNACGGSEDETHAQAEVFPTTIPVFTPGSVLADVDMNTLSTGTEPADDEGEAVALSAADPTATPEPTEEPEPTDTPEPEASDDGAGVDAEDVAGTSAMTETAEIDDSAAISESVEPAEEEVADTASDEADLPEEAETDDSEIGDSEIDDSDAVEIAPSEEITVTDAITATAEVSETTSISNTQVLTDAASLADAEPITSTEALTETTQISATGEISTTDTASDTVAGVDTEEDTGEDTDDADTGTVLSVPMADLFFGETMTNLTDPPIWTVTSGEEVTLELDNIGGVQHNWAVIKEGEEVPVPFSPETDTDIVLYDPGVLEPGESRTVTFEAPIPGLYTVICTVAGHYPVMQGKLEVK